MHTNYMYFTTTNQSLGLVFLKSSMLELPPIKKQILSYSHVGRIPLKSIEKLTKNGTHKNY